MIANQRLEHVEIELEIERLSPLRSSLLLLSTLDEKLDLLNTFTLQISDLVENWCMQGDMRTQIVVRSLYLIQQADQFFSHLSHLDKAAFDRLIEALWPVEEFYNTIGGLIGYHCELLLLIRDKNKPQKIRGTYQKPPLYELGSNTPYTRSGIESLDQFAEIYPIGGAGDRLDLRENGVPLPAALLSFSGRTLLDGLIRDLEAREHLYSRITGKPITTPILLMTSSEKNNHEYILNTCREKNWWQRSEENFFFIEQPLVPVVSDRGVWMVNGQRQPLLKPGGHGVIWKLAKDRGAFEWFKSKNRSKAIVRQINNPIAGLDCNLFALAGIGVSEDKAFGFISCPRVVGAAEGSLVMHEERCGRGWRRSITNIEYTDFAKRGIEDLPEFPGGLYSQFPSNTNILFADLLTVERAVDSCPIPGKIVNFKNCTSNGPENPSPIQHTCGRLESTMQNIADTIFDEFSEKSDDPDRTSLRSFILYQQREKTISVTKRSCHNKSDYKETPECAFYDLLKNSHRVLRDECGFTLPEIVPIEEYLQSGPNILLSWHPALGPLYGVIAQKLRSGVISNHSELVLEISELSIENLDLAGSFIVESDTPTSPCSGVGRCFLRNATIRNGGIDRSRPNCYLKNHLYRKETFRILLKGNAEFYAEDVEICGNVEIEVAHNQRCRAVWRDGRVQFLFEEMDRPSWEWRYSFDSSDRVALVMHTASSSH